MMPLVEENPAPLLLRVTAADLCAGALFDCDPPLCIKAADRICFFVGHGLDRCIRYCDRQGWQFEIHRISSKD